MVALTSSGGDFFLLKPRKDMSAREPIQGASKPGRDERRTDKPCGQHCVQELLIMAQLLSRTICEPPRDSPVDYNDRCNFVRVR